MKIANKSVKKILNWVLENNKTGFTMGDLKKRLGLKEDKKLNEIWGYLKQPGLPNEAFIKTFDNSGRYYMTSKVISELNSLKKPLHETLVGFIIFSVLIGVIIAVIIYNFGLNNIK